MQFLKKFTTKEKPVEYFFALNLSEETIRAAAWTVKEGKTQAVQLGEAVKWDGQDKDSLLKAADRSLSQASEGLRPEPNGVIFGLPETWVEKDAINQEKKIYLKLLCEELALKPLGFVVTDTAIIAYLKIEEGMPISAILMQLSSSEINLTLVKMGKIIGSQLVGRSGDLGADAEEGLSRFEKVDAFPARIILYNGGGDFEESKQQLLSYDWEEKLPFIHFPKVESLSSEVTVRAVALAGGSEVAQSLGIEVKVQARPEAETAETLGFVTGEDAAAAAVKEEVPETEPTTEKPKIKIQPLVDKLKKIKIRLPRFGGRWPLAAGSGLAAAAILLVLLYWNVPKASVVLYLEPQLVKQELEITLDPQAHTLTADSYVLPVQLAEKSVSGEKIRETTGTKTVGDPAKGGATVYNKTAATKTFPAGTVLLDSQQLTFTLDEETTVASRSAEEDSEGVITITPGKAEAKITAVNIGPDSNLAADARLSFKQFSEDDYYAKSSGLSGGTAREVKAVADEDLGELEADLIADLIETAKTDLRQSLGPDQVLVEREKTATLADKNFSQAEGEAADTLTLMGQLDYEGIVYRQAELDLILKEAIREKIPENFVISEFSNLELGEVTEMTLPIEFEAKLLPRLDFNEIKNNLKGRQPAKVEEYLVGLPQFVSADIQIKPDLPQVLKTLPRITKNISLEIKPAP